MVNDYFLALARRCESVAQGERGQINYPVNRVEVLASCLQALLQTLSGSQPAFTAMPNDIPMDATDAAQVSVWPPVYLTWQPYVPPLPSDNEQPGTVANVPADGSASVTVTYADGFAFATNTNEVLVGVKNDFQANPWALTFQTTNYTPNGFTVNVGGGPPSSTVTITYLAVGD